MVDSNKEVNRRGVLKSIGAAGTGAIGASALTSDTASADSLQTPDTEPLHGRERTAAIRDLYSKEETRYLVREFYHEGWRLSFAHGKYRRVLPDDEEDYRVIVIPFRRYGRHNNDINATLTWDESSGRVFASRIDSSDESGVNENDIVEQVYTVDENTNTVSSESSALSDHIGEENVVDTQDEIDDGGGGAPTCYDITDYCIDYNWTCITLITITAGACAAGAGLACLATLGATALSYADDEGCNICDERYSDEIDVCGA